jgi:hypothetical protein
MNAPRRILIFGGLVLAAVGMTYGLHYALFVEHQTLDQMGGSLASGFAHAAESRMPEATAAIASYGATKYNYVRQVDVHSHWIGLAMILIVLGVVFDQMGFSAKVRSWLAISLLAGAVLFPLGVILETVSAGAGPKALAIVGTILVVISLAIVTVGFSRSGAKNPAS